MKINKKAAFYKYIALLLCLMFAFTNVYAEGEAEKEEDQRTGVNAVLIVDTSGSMWGTDPNRVAIEGTKLFIDMMENSGSSVGVIGFNGGIANEIPITEINSQADKDAIKAKVNAFAYDGETDMGLALTRGVQMIEDHGTDNNVIVFLTDGKIDFYEGNNTRTIAQSEMEVNEALKKINRAYPIYTIGLNANGQVDENIIKKMAVETDAEMNVVTDAAQLPKIYNKIFASFIQSDTATIDMPSIGSDGISTAKFTVPNASVLEANIMVFTDRPLDDIYVTGPNATPQTVKTVSSRYSMLKVIRPEEGEWTVTVKGQPGCKIETSLLFNYDIEIDAKLERSAYAPGEKVHATAILTSEGKPITDEILYNNIYAEAILKGENLEDKSFPMEYKKGEFVVDIPVSDMGKYTIEIKTNGDKFYRLTEPISFEVTTLATPVEREPEKAPSKLINPIILIPIAALIIAAVIIIKKVTDRQKNKTKQLKGVLYVTNENGFEQEVSLSGNKGGVTLANILKKLYYTDVETEFDLKGIVIYFFFERETGIEIVNKTPYKMRAGEAFSGELKHIVLKSEQAVKFVKGEGENEQVLLIRYEYI